MDEITQGRGGKGPPHPGNRAVRGGNSSRPPGLKGRDIGMYYRNLSKRKKELGEDENVIRLGASVSVPPGVLSRVEGCLDRFSEHNENNESVCTEFEERFRHLLGVDFEKFIAESKEVHNNEEAVNTDLNDRFQTDLQVKEKTKEFQQRYQQRMQLPAMKQGANILEVISSHQVLLIVGSTGCGKTTQVPQLLLDEFIKSGRGSQCRIVCTQPRRISAVSVAERVAYERCERLGSSVGYQIRLESKMPREHGSILYCTTGILLQKMQSDPLMNGLSAIILDEIHERSVETDLLMALIKKILPHRPDLKVILMSATVSEQDFCDYFDQCFMLRIEGMLYHVTEHYLEDILQETHFNQFQKLGHHAAGTKHGRQQRGKGGRGQQRQDAERGFEYGALIEPYLRQIRDKYDSQVIEALRFTDSEGCDNIQFLEFLIFHICEHKPPGAILVFLPGFDKISKLNAVLQKPTLPAGQRFRHQIEVYPLHSMMPTVNQQSVFLPPPRGKRKIILSTILAETSVTIDDVVYVINTGRTKISSYNVDANIQTLEEAWVTRANSQQRKGRAGRVQPGICYHLFTKARERTMSDVPTPEILRCKLESIILNLKLLHIEDVFEFLKTLINAPNPTAIQNGIKLLKRIDALDERGLTPLGMHLARLPIDPQMGKMILMAALFRCLDPISSVAAGLSFKSPFYTPLGQEQNVDRTKRRMAVDMHSDHLLVDNCILKFREALNDGAERDFCYENFLSISTLQQLENMKKQFAELLHGASFTESGDCRNDASNKNSNNIPLLRAIIAAGLYPNMAHLRKSRTIRNRVHAIHSMSTPEDSRINFHPSSVNSGASSFDSNFFVYFQKQKSSALYILDATMVFPTALIIFGDGVETGMTPDGQTYISVAQSYYFKCDEVTSTVMVRLRRRLDWLMQKKALYPSPIAPNSSEEHLIKAIQILLSMDEVVEYEDQFLSSDDDD